MQTLLFVALALLFVEVVRIFFGPRSVTSSWLVLIVWLLKNMRLGCWMYLHGGHREVPWTNNPSPQTDLRCAAVILLVGYAAPNMTCSAPFTAHLMLAGVEHHRRDVVVGDGYGDTEEIISPVK